MLGLVYILSTVDRRFTLQAIELRKLGDFTGAEIILPDLECELARVVAALNVLCEETVQ